MVGPDGRGQAQGRRGALRRTWTEGFEPTLFLYDNYPGGIGLLPPFTHAAPRLVAAALDLVTGCPCPAGCPACVGPVLPGGRGPPHQPQGRGGDGPACWRGVAMGFEERLRRVRGRRPPPRRR